MNYCPKCGTRLEKKLEGGRERLACPACSYVFFGEFSIGVGGVVIRDGKVLLIRRGQEPFKGWWQIPGGYAEQDEEIEQAVEREVYEESGVRARAKCVLGLRNSLGQPSTNVYVIFLMEPLDGEARRDGEESAEVGFFSPAEIAEMENVQNLSKWAIRVALSGRQGLVRVEEANLRRPGYLLFGLPDRGFGRPIGTVRSPVVEAVDENWGEVVAEIHVAEELAPGLLGLEQFSHALIVFHMHQAAFDPARDLQRRPRGRADLPLVGTFAQRARHRPNPLGVTAVRVLGVEGNVLRVQGLDAIDGTPVLDVKPYYPVYDRVAEAVVPEWVDRLMEGYF